MRHQVTEAPVRPGQVRAHLHTATSRQHQLVESLMPMQDGRLTPASYRNLLQQLGKLYAGLEKAVMPQASALNCLGAAWQSRRKLTLLVSDLHCIGGHVGEPLEVAPWSSFAAALGCLYVTEGATLGGQVIARRVGCTLGYTPDHGVAFFCSYGKAVGPMWRTFCQILETSLTDAALLQEATLAATATFALFERVLRERQEL